jgi:4-hydroxy-2-oxoglutarate aldolase
VLTGAANTLLEALEAGAAGAILGLAACTPQACQEIYFAWKDHDLKLAAEKQQRILAANKFIVGELGIGGIKHACDFNGFYGGRPRIPLIAPSSKERLQIEQLLADIRN